MSQRERIATLRSGEREKNAKRKGETSRNALTEKAREKTRRGEGGKQIPFCLSDQERGLKKGTRRKARKAKRKKI